MAAIPLFPLNSLVFPKGRISLQIFESRYVDMIRQCMRDETGFGIVLIEHGSEVVKPHQKLDIHRVGTYCHVVDWNQLASGLLGITAEGKLTFKICESWHEQNGLCMAEVDFREHDGVNSDPIDVGNEFAEYVQLLTGLSTHPVIEDMKLNIRFDNLLEVAWRLSDLLPIANAEKQALLEMDDTIARLEQIQILINSMNQ